MLNLPVFRQLAYVSPSTFNKWENCQMSVYLEKLAGHPWEKEESGLAADIGNAFDAYVKDYVAQKRGIKGPHLNLDVMLRKIDHPEANEAGRMIAKAYIECGWAQEFLDHRGDLHLDMELIGRREGVPILGQLDMIVDVTPFDWKTRGFTSEKGTSPSKGWKEKVIISTGTGRILDREKNKHGEIPLEEINRQWAVQMCFYNWLLVNRIDMPYIIDEICHMPGNRMQIARHVGQISESFQAQIANKLGKMWGQITDQMYHATLDIPTPSSFRCEKYKKICKVAHHCHFYAKSLGDPDSRGSYA